MVTMKMAAWQFVHEEMDLRQLFVQALVQVFSVKVVTVWQTA